MAKPGRKQRRYKGDLCITCGYRRVSSHGKGRWKAQCRTCIKKPWTLAKKAKCDACGFVAIHKCQLDVDHIDGNGENHSPDNLQTLCANCHRLKTFVNRDWRSNNQPIQLTLFLEDKP